MARLVEGLCHPVLAVPDELAAGGWTTFGGFRSAI